MEKMLETIFQRSRNVPCRKCTVLFGLRKWLNTHTIPTHCDNTVAIAAPRMPHFSQKMNIGARMMFMPTVNTAESMAFCGYPVARMMWLSPNMVQVTGRPYRMIDLHEIAGIGQGVLAGPESRQHRIKHQLRQQAERHPVDEAEQQDVAEHAGSAVDVLLPQPDGTDGRAADADEQNQSEGQVHDRKRDRKAGNGQRTDAVPDKNTVDDVVKGKDHHRGDGGQGIAEKQFSDRFCSQQKRGAGVSHMYLPCLYRLEQYEIRKSVLRCRAGREDVALNGGRSGRESQKGEVGLF